MKKMCSWCTAGERASKGETRADQMTDSFQAHKDDAAIIEPSACEAVRACEETALRCMCSVDVCTVYKMTSSLTGVRNHSGAFAKDPSEKRLKERGTCFFKYLEDPAMVPTGVK